jgi:hypothetical protein
LILFSIAVFLVPGAQAAFGELGTTDPAAGAGTTGAQQALGSCPTPKIRGLPKNPKFTNATIHLKLVDLVKGSAYLVKAGRIEVFSKTADASTAKFAFQLPDQGTKSRKIPIQAIVASEQCENSPWKVTKKIRYKAVVAPTPAPTPAPAPAATPTTPKPAAATPTLAKPITPPKAAKPADISPALQEAPNLDIRTWLTPLDGQARSVKPLPVPRALKRDRPKQKAQSTAALVGLGGLFLVVAAGTIGGLWFLKRRDDYSLEEALGQLPQHLEEGSPDLAPQDEPPAMPLPAELSTNGEHPPAETAPVETPTPEPVAAEPQGAEAPTVEQLPAVEQPEPVEQAPAVEQPPAVEPAVTAASTPAPENGNGTHSPSANRAQVEAELQRMLSEAGIDAELEGILGEARAEAERQGISIDPDLMLGALCDELSGSGALSEPARAELRSKFQQIIAEEATRVPQQAS